ncbi:MAG: lysophospholipid acyltransferase family protein [Endomicrobiales bacterium]|nr:lysophospholipid acyltransferase family protein [Endomicrobiales bacterium]
MKKIKRYFYYIFALVLSKLILLIPFRLAVKLGGLLGLWAYYAVQKSRNVCIGNLKASFPEKSAPEIENIAKKVFVNQGKNMMELFSYPKLGQKDVEKLMKVENRQALDAALALGKGVLLASAHCGSWEITGVALSSEGFPINAIARRIYIEGLNRMLLAYRRSKGINVIMRSDRETAKDILKGLKRNQVVAMLIDQDTEVPGVFVDFFGRPAWTPSGLASLALRIDVGVVVALDVRNPDDTHTVKVTGPVELRKSGDMGEDIKYNTQRVTAMIEEHIKRYPEQWVWMHERWKTKEAKNA